MSGENEPGEVGYGEPKDHAPNVRPPSGGKAKGASAEHQSPPVMHLEDHHIAKLFGKKMPPIGSKIKVHGLIHVGAYNENQEANPSGGKAKGGEGNTKRTMALHFHKMDIAQDNQRGEKTVDQEAERAAGAKAEMDKALKREEGGHVTGGSKSPNEEGRGTKRVAPQGNNGPR